MYECTNVPMCELADTVLFHFIPKIIDALHDIVLVHFEVIRIKVLQIAIS